MTETTWSIPSASLRKTTIEPSILYFGTPVALICTQDPDGSTNIGPMSSAWALGKTVVMGWATKAWTLDNLARTGECTINLASAELMDNVERLAPLTGRNPVPAAVADTFRYEPDKFTAAGLTMESSETVVPPRIREYRLQLEAEVTAIHSPAGPDANQFRIVETHVRRVHADPAMVIDGTDHIDPAEWNPLLYVFRHYFTTGPRLGKTFRANDNAH
ncbi:flavin reductase family protein [Nocardia sp. NPDC020380]|uniref:flavin reductase family protein n=1 Tax=Nocardia sp. NPDC020380 TaxID=3364309 RepID=UPI0037BB7F7A